MVMVYTWYAIQEDDEHTTATSPNQNHEQSKAMEESKDNEKQTRQGHGRVFDTTQHSTNKQTQKYDNIACFFSLPG